MIDDLVEQENAHIFLADWPAKVQEPAQSMIQKYGTPDEMTASRLIWHNNWPWKRTIIYRDEMRHLFPVPHADLLEQTIAYRVPPQAFATLANYNGSIIAERTTGELSARCDREEMNFLALNLAHDLIAGKRSVSEARQIHTELAVAFLMGELHPYTQGLQFEMPKHNPADPDEPDVQEAMKGMAKTMKEKSDELQELAA